MPQLKKMKNHIEYKQKILKDVPKKKHNMKQIILLIIEMKLLLKYIKMIRSYHLQKIQL